MKKFNIIKTQSHVFKIYYLHFF